MTNKQMDAIYKMAKAIYNKQERLTDGKNQLLSQEGINPNSFADYYRALQKMLDGELHTHNISADLRNYFLQQIFLDYGASKLRVALDAYRKHINYYEKTYNTKRKREWEIYNEYIDLLHAHGYKE